MNSYGLTHFWQQGDFVTRFVALVLLVMSVVTWIVIAYKAIQFWRVRQNARSISTRFWHNKNFAEGVQSLGAPESNNLFRTLALEGLQSVEHHHSSQDDLHGVLSLSDWLNSCLRRALDNASAHLGAGLSVLASIGSTAPFVGLFGTVWGIYHALLSIGQSGQVGLDQVAGPVGEALIMTAFGLAVAIPAVLGYNALLRRQKSLMAQMGNFAHDLHAYFVTGSRMNRPFSEPVGQNARSEANGVEVRA
ncbi:MAG: MotA/TolQ/ExbB proton channel family protein [Burkholderiaceae bacterium]|jgi:biopolymer transport protein ExbB